MQRHTSFFKNNRRLLQTGADFCLLLVLVLLFCGKFYHSDFIFQSDVLLNIYLQHFYSLMEQNWDPYVLGYTGVYPISGSYFPSNWLMHRVLALFFIPSPKLTLISMMAHATMLLWMLAISSYLFFRFQLRSRGGALLGALVLTFSGFIVHSSIREMNLFYLISMLFIPWVLHCLVQANKQKSWHWSVAAGGCIGLSLLGGSNVPMFMLAPMLPFIGICIAPTSSHSPKESRGIVLAYGFLHAGIAFITGLLLGAAAYLPAAVYLRYTRRSEDVLQNVMTLDYAGADFLLKTIFAYGETGITNPNYYFFIGLPVLFLAGIGYFKATANMPLKKFMMVLIIYALSCMMMRKFPQALENVYSLLMQMMSIRHNNRFFMILMLPLAWFASLGYDRLHFWRQPSLQLPSKLKLMGLLSRIFFGYLGLVFVVESSARVHLIYQTKNVLSFTHLGLLLFFIVLLLGLVVEQFSIPHFGKMRLKNLIGAKHEGTIQRNAVIVFIILIMILYFIKTHSLVTVYSEVFTLPLYLGFALSGVCLVIFFSPAKFKVLSLLCIFAIYWLQIPDVTYYQEVKTPSLQSSIEQWFTEPIVRLQPLIAAEKEPFRYFDLSQEQRTNFWSPLAKVEVAFEPAFDPNTPIYISKYIQQFMTIDQGQFRCDIHSTLMDLYNIKYLRLQNYPGKKFNPTTQREIYENPQAFPRYFLTNTAVVMKNDAELFEKLGQSSREELQRQTLFVQSDWEKFLAQGDQPLSQNSAPEKIGSSQPSLDLGDDQIQLLEKTDLTLRLRVNLSQNGWLNLTELWFPAWHVWVDGVERPMLRGNGVFWAVQLNAGQHHLVFQFDDPWRKVANSLSGITALVLMLGAARARAKAKAIGGTSKGKGEKRLGEQAPPNPPYRGGLRRIATNSHLLCIASLAFDFVFPKLMGSKATRTKSCPALSCPLAGFGMKR